MGKTRRKRAERNRLRAQKARLRYIHSFKKGIRRRRCGRGYTYISSSGRRITSAGTISRISSLVIPPAWRDVWICSSAKGHIQATGRDEAGRKQYIYHPHWQQVSSERKFDRMQRFAQKLPGIRRKVRRDLSGAALSKKSVIAAVIRLLDKAHIRIGNEQYLKENGSRGATTLKKRDVEVSGEKILLDFPGKGGKRNSVELSDRLAAEVIKRCESAKGRYLFHYRTDEGDLVRVSSGDINHYLQQISGERITAKDFRTWWGSVAALQSLRHNKDWSSKRARTAAVRQAVAEAADALGNTKSICRKSYIHPGLLNAAERGELPRLIAKAKQSKAVRSLTADERTLARLLPQLEFE